MENTKGHTILIVDDEPDILEFLSYNVRKEGYKVFTASNGIEALRLVQQINPSLILLDVMMPKMDGIETCQVIRKDLNMVQPVIAFLTARTEDYAQIAGLKQVPTTTSVNPSDHVYSLAKLNLYCAASKIKLVQKAQQISLSIEIATW